MWAYITAFGRPASGSLTRLRLDESADARRKGGLRPCPGEGGGKRRQEPAACRRTTTLRRHVGALEASAKARFEVGTNKTKVRRFKEIYDGAASWSRVEK